MPTVWMSRLLNDKIPPRIFTERVDAGRSWCYSGHMTTERTETKMQRENRNCPKCGSDNVIEDDLDNGTVAVVVCEDCNWER